LPQKEAEIANKLQKVENKLQKVASKLQKVTPLYQQKLKLKNFYPGLFISAKK